MRARHWWIAIGLVLVLASGVGLMWVTGDPAQVTFAQPSPPSSPAPADPSASAGASPSPAVSNAPSAAPVTSTKAAPRPPVGTTVKKGVCTWNFSDNPAAMKEVGAAWYHNWAASPSAGVTGAEFVPVIWGANSVNAGNLNKAKASGKVLLGFNEPDFASQANMSVEQALDLWPQLQATGLRLGSPAVAVGGATAGGWLDRFITGARQRGLRVDFIAVHWYGSDFGPNAVNHLSSYLKAVHDRYGLPIWLTEFALIKFGSGGASYPSADQQVAFINGATATMGGLSYVERYAWFSLPTPDEGGTGTGLYQKDQGLTPGGTAFRAVR